MIQKKMKIFLINIIILVFVVLCAFLADYYHLEYFEDSADIDNILLNYVKEKSSTYFPYISDFFFSNTTLANSKINMDIKRQMFQFLPTYGDSICANVESEKPMSCSNIFINNISFSDPVNYKSEMECTSIDATVSPDKTQCFARILNNKYSLQKKCMRFNTNSNLNKSVEVKNNYNGLSMISSIRSMDTPVIREALQLGASSNSSILKVLGNLDLFALLQPNMISIGNFGVYHINYNENSSNMFASYNSTYVGNRTLVLENIETKDVNINIFPGKVANLPHLLQKPNWNLMSTIYYFNYENAVVTSDNQIVNTFNLIFDKKYIKTLFVNDVKDATVDVAITSTTTSSPTLSYLSGISFKFNFDPDANFPFMRTLVNYGSATSAPIIYDCDPQFSHRVYDLIRNEDMISNDKMFHVVVTCTLDRIKIVTFYKEILNGINEFQIMSSPMKNTENPIFVQYNLSTLKSTINNPLLDHYKTNYIYMCPYSVIPNYALIAKRLGYII